MVTYIRTDRVTRQQTTITGKQMDRVIRAGCVYHNPANIYAELLAGRTIRCYPDADYRKEQ